MNSRYEVGTRPAEREDERTVIQPDPSGRRVLVRNYFDLR